TLKVTGFENASLVFKSQKVPVCGPVSRCLCEGMSRVEVFFPGACPWKNQIDQQIWLSHKDRQITIHMGVNSHG
ncbi:MAG: hypothetical protein IKU95_00465, partial [Clostridia bacterium]|nr:hypothetical protein [Clostridia bacterium]